MMVCERCHKKTHIIYITLVYGKICEKCYDFVIKKERYGDDRSE